MGAPPGSPICILGSEKASQKLIRLSRHASALLHGSQERRPVQPFSGKQSPGVFSCVPTPPFHPL
jgi:hypothetical protein